MADALISEARGLVFTSNRGENTIAIFAPETEADIAKVEVGIKPNGLALDPVRSILIAANVGDGATIGSHTISVVDVEKRRRIAEFKVAGRTRWAVDDSAREKFFVDISSPAQIVVIDARHPTSIAAQYEVPAAGPHGLDLDATRGRLFCACDAAVLFSIEAASGRILQEVRRSGGPDVIFFNPQINYVAIESGVIDVIETTRLERVGWCLKAGAHTLALDRRRNTVYAFLPQSHRAAVFEDAH